MQAQAKTTRDTVTASATAFRATRVGIVLSSYEGGGDHFGNAKFTGVAEPRPVAAELTDTQLRNLTRRAIELANHPDTGFRRVLAKGESVLLLVNRHTEPAVVAGFIDILKAAGAGERLTILTDAPERFSGASVVDIAKAEVKRMPAPGVWSRRDVSYQIPQAILDCDRLISIAPLRADKGRPSLTLDNYRTLVRAQPGTQASADLTALDLFGFHPADFVVLGGTQVLRDGVRKRHNVVLAGAVATAVDSAGAAVLRIKPGIVRHLRTAHERGFGDTDLDTIWTIGNEIEDARIAL